MQLWHPGEIISAVNTDLSRCSHDLFLMLMTGSGWHQKRLDDPNLAQFSANLPFGGLKKFLIVCALQFSIFVAATRTRPLCIPINVREARGGKKKKHWMYLKQRVKNELWFHIILCLLCRHETFWDHTNLKPMPLPPQKNFESLTLYLIIWLSAILEGTKKDRWVNEANPN